MAIAALAVSPGAAACDADKLIRHYGMQTVPKEGVWFTVTYESADRIDGAALPPRYGGRSHPAVSAIVALETAAAFSALHRLKTDETWHFYGGDPIDLLLLPPDGQSRRVVLGSDVLAGQTPQFTVPAGVWQGSSPLTPKGKGCSLFGTELAPAFAYEDFEIGYRDQLTAGFPAEASRIAELTRADPSPPQRRLPRRGPNRKSVRPTRRRPLPALPACRSRNYSAVRRRCAARG